jgi:hypothetical protein
MERPIDVTTWTQGKGSSPIENLKSAAKEDERNATTLHQLLWLLNVHPELPGLVQVCRHVREMLLLLPEGVKPSLPKPADSNLGDPSDAGVKAPPLDAMIDLLQLNNWIPVLDWITSDPKNLAKRVFHTSTSGNERLSQRFLETTRNPIANFGAKRHGLYCMLWASHPAEEFRKPFRLFQTHVLIAHICVMSYATTLDDWVSEKEPSAGFYLSLYRPTWLTRRFTRVKGDWPEALRSVTQIRALPASADQKISLSSRLRDMSQRLWEAANRIDETPQPDHDKSKSSSQKKGVNATAHSLRGLAGFIERGLDPANYVKRKRSNANGNWNGGGKTIGGAGDTEIVAPPVRWGLGKMKMVYGDPDDRREPTVTVHLPVRWRRKPKLYERLVAAGDHPAEELSSQHIQFAEDAAGAAMAAGGGIEMANQLLPWAYQDLSTGELAKFLCNLQALSAGTNPEVLEIRALVNAMLWTGASFDQALSLYIILDETPDSDCDLALRVINYDSDGPMAAEWRVRALTLPLKTTPPPAKQARERSYFLTLPDTVGGTGPVQDFLKYQRFGAKEPSAQPEIMKARPLRMFRREFAWYRRALREIFVKLDKVGRITTTRISRVLFQTVVEQSGEDIVSAALITGTDHPLASVRRFYDTPEVWYLQQAYTNATTTLKEKLALAGYHQEVSERTVVGRTRIAVGSPLCPTLIAMQDAIRWLKDEIYVPFAPGNLVRKHNTYTLYSVWCFGFAVGVRGVRTPYLHSDAVDQHSGLSTITDKDKGTGYKSRFVWVPHFVREQMKRYEFYLSNMADSLGLPAATRKRPCYLLDDKAKPVVVSPRTMAPLLDQFFPFPANVARHLVSTELKERGVAPENIVAWLGHHYRGQEPWGRYSSFSFLNYKQELEQVLSPFLTKVLGFEPLPPQGPGAQYDYIRPTCRDKRIRRPLHSRSHTASIRSGSPPAP